MVEKNIVKLVCEDCGGTMDIDSNKEVMMCPFCGSKKIILESDEVKIAKADVEKQRINRDIELAKIDETKRKDKEENVGLILLFVFAAVLMLTLVCLTLRAL